MLFRLVLKDIANLFRTRKLLSVLLICGIAVSFLAFHMMFGIIKLTLVASRGFSAFSTYSIDFDDLVTSDNMAQVEHIIDSSDLLRTALIMRINEDSPMIVGWHGANDDRWFVQDEGRFFTETELSEGANLAILSGRLYSRPDFDYASFPTKIASEHFEIIGFGILPTNRIFFTFQDALYEKYYPPTDESQIHSHAEDDAFDETQQVNVVDQAKIIPYKNFLKLGLKPQVVRLEYDIKDADSYYSILRQLEETFPNAMIMPPVLPQTHFSETMQADLLQAVGIVAVALVNIAALFIYWLQLNRTVYRTYMTCGASKKTVASLMLCEWLVIVSISFFIAILAQNLLTPVTELLEISFRFDLIEYVAIFLGGYLLSLLFMIPQIKQNTQLLNRRNAL